MYQQWTNYIERLVNHTYSRQAV